MNHIDCCIELQLQSSSQCSKFVVAIAIALTDTICFDTLTTIERKKN